MAFRAQQVGYRQDDLAGRAPLLEFRLQRGPHVRMLDGASDTSREDLRVRYPRGGASAPVHLVTGHNAVDARRPFRQVKLGGIFQVGHPPVVHLLGDPALVADMGMTAALVQRGEDPLYLGRAAARGGKPGTVGTMGVEVCRGLTGADLRETSPPGFKPPQGLGRRIRPIRVGRAVDRGSVRTGVVRLAVGGPEGSPRPAGDRPLLQVGGVLGAAARLDALPERPLPGPSLRNAAVGPRGLAGLAGLVGAAP
jgi:hypothetical protein